MNLTMTRGQLEHRLHDMRPMPILGIIGGSGVYTIDGLQNSRWEQVGSPFGKPSDSLMFGELDGVSVVFLSRYGRGHMLSPCEKNHPVNIDVLKRGGLLT